jgi:uridine kinase
VTYADLVKWINSRPARLGDVRLVAIDGPSGAGKTWFAGRLAAELGDAPVIHTDDLLDGWDDQFTSWPRIERLALAPLRAGRAARYRRYQWDTGDFTGDPVVVEPAPVVLLEGVGSARGLIRPELSLAVFVTAPAGLRLERTVARDAGHDLAFRAYLERWRIAEDRHFADEGTAASADLVVDGAADSSDEVVSCENGVRR